MSARREHRLRNLERRVAELETIAATPVFIHTKGDGGEDYVLEAVWSKEEADTHPDKRLSLLDRSKISLLEDMRNETVHRDQDY